MTLYYIKQPIIDIRICLYFFDLTTLQVLGQKFVIFFSFVKEIILKVSDLWQSFLSNHFKGLDHSREFFHKEIDPSVQSQTYLADHQEIYKQWWSDPNLRPFEDSELTSPKEIRINHTNIMLDSVTRSNMIHQSKTAIHRPTVA